VVLAAPGWTGSRPPRGDSASLRLRGSTRTAQHLGAEVWRPYWEVACTLLLETRCNWRTVSANTTSAHCHGAHVAAQTAPSPARALRKSWPWGSSGAPQGCGSTPGSRGRSSCWLVVNAAPVPVQCGNWWRCITTRFSPGGGVGGATGQRTLQLVVGVYARLLPPHLDSATATRRKGSQT
jgi:hypothetical protein